MFLRHHNRAEGAVWRHYISENGIDWQIFDPFLFDCAGENPGMGATDIMLVKNIDGTFSGKVLACGLEDKVLKLWLYTCTEVTGQGTGNKEAT